MNQREVFVIHKRSLYTHRVYKNPSRKEETYSKTTNPGLLPFFGDGSVSFVVEWQLPVIDMHGFGRESTHDTSTALSWHSAENRNSEKELETTKGLSTYISDW